MSKNKKITLTAYNEETVTFAYEGEVFTIPKDLYEGELKVGMTVYLNFLNNDSKDKEDATLAKNILNSLFGTHEKNS